MKVILLVLVAAATLIQAKIDLENVSFKKDLVPQPLRNHRLSLGSRIVGGQEAPPHAFYYQAAIFTYSEEGRHLCGGSLISTKFVLTAAHCLEKAFEATVMLGVHNLISEEATRQEQQSTKFVVHEGWSRSSVSNDIGLIELPEEVELNDYVQLIRLPSRSDAQNSYVDSEAVATGWGKEKDSPAVTSPVLRYMSTSVIPNSLCDRFYGLIGDGHICTASTRKTSTCNGDSGGPLVAHDVQVGITSFGSMFGCESGFPSVFTRVSSYLDWIQEHSDVVLME